MPRGEGGFVAPSRRFCPSRRIQKKAECAARFRANGEAQNDARQLTNSVGVPARVRCLAIGSRNAPREDAAKSDASRSARALFRETSSSKEMKPIRDARSSWTAATRSGSAGRMPDLRTRSYAEVHFHCQWLAWLPKKALTSRDRTFRNMTTRPIAVV